jgi:ElaA protein
MQLNWIYKPFDELTPKELYAILHLRSEVFVVEQNCVYLDMDFKDEKSFHLAGWDGDRLVAYVRIVPPGISFNDPSIGRVVTSPAYRKGGAGRQLMQLAIEKTLEQFNHRTITIGAQLYLKQFYGSLGFVQISEQYIEDGIPHIHMQLTAEN